MNGEKVAALGTLPLFEPLSEGERERLAAGCRIRTFTRGAFLFREGERAEGMLIVLSGVVKVVRFTPDGRETVLHLVRPGNTLGEGAMFQRGTFPASAVAVDDVRALFLEAEALFGMVAENPGLATYLLHRRQIGGGDVVRLGVSREVLANLLGLARETLSRQLSRFAENGLVALEGRDIVLLDVPGLREVAGRRRRGGR